MGDGGIPPSRPRREPGDGHHVRELHQGRVEPHHPEFLHHLLKAVDLREGLVEAGDAPVDPGVVPHQVLEVAPADGDPGDLHELHLTDGG
ncbi:unnamed protein product, partial [marine sediment metagenome]